MILDLILGQTLCLPTQRSGAGGVSVCFSPAHLDHLLPEPGPEPGYCRKSMNIIPERVPVVPPGIAGFIWMYRKVLQTPGIASISWVPPIHPPRALLLAPPEAQGWHLPQSKRHPPGKGPLSCPQKGSVSFQVLETPNVKACPHLLPPSMTSPVWHPPTQL